MEVSKLNITRNALEKNKLTPKRKLKLRQQAVIQYIESRPYGETISIADFGRIANYPTPENIAPMIKTMLKKGLIRREMNPGTSRYSYEVVKKVTTRKATPASTAPPHEHSAPQLSTERLLTIEEMAKEYVWLKHTDSLRDFVAYLKGMGVE